MAVSGDVVGVLTAEFEALLPHLDERSVRLVLAARARSLGHGGIAAVARASGASRSRVQQGVAELESGAGPLGRVSRPGGGRKPATQADPVLLPALLALVEPTRRGDPESALSWTTLSVRRLAAELTAAGHAVSQETVAKLLRAEGLSLQANAKTVEGGQHPDRDAPRRRPVLARWPESPAARKKMRSSYHHAFLLMARAHDELQANDTLETRLDAQLLFPNLIRRVLESFLAFKRPGQTGDFTGAMRETTAMLEQSGYEGDAEALRQQLTRYTHAYSHSETPDTNDVVNPDEIASALAAVFSFMKQLDEGHFCGLCEVVGVDPEHLVPPTAVGDESATPTGGDR